MEIKFIIVILFLNSGSESAVGLETFIATINKT